MFGIWFLQALQGPLGDGVFDISGEVEGREGVEAFDVAALADARHPAAVAGSVCFVGFLDGELAYCFLGLADAAGGFDTGYGGV